MKVAIISDIHGNCVALDAVRTHADATAATSMRAICVMRNLLLTGAATAVMRELIRPPEMVNSGTTPNSVNYAAKKKLRHRRVSSAARFGAWRGDARRAFDRLRFHETVQGCVDEPACGGGVGDVRGNRGAAAGDTDDIRSGGGQRVGDATAESSAGTGHDRCRAGQGVGGLVHIESETR